MNVGREPFHEIDSFLLAFRFDEHSTDAQEVVDLSGRVVLETSGRLKEDHRAVDSSKSMHDNAGSIGV